MNKRYYLLFIFFIPLLIVAQSPIGPLWVPNGQVRTMVEDSNKMYIGGDFTMIGPATPYGSIFSNQSSNELMNQLNANNEIRVVVPDGTGGWYIGGAFTSILGVTRNRVAQILADGSLGSWNPNASGAVNSIVVEGSLVYLGGEFTTISSLSRSKIAVLDKNGIVQNWSTSTINGLIYSIVIDQHNLYAGGSFTTVGGTTRNRMAIFDKSTAALTNLDFPTNNTVKSLAINNSYLYVGGTFTTLSGITRNRIGAIDLSTNVIANWNPNANNTVNCITLIDTLVYIGGSFTKLGSITRNYLASVGQISGTLENWNPNFNAAVNCISYTGQLMYVGGNFTLCGSQKRMRLACFDLNGQLTSWAPIFDKTVLSISEGNTNTVFIGGQFTSSGGVERFRLAAIDLSTGIPNSWSPVVNNSVYSILINNGKLYLGGSFTQVNGIVRNRMASFDLHSGVLTTFNPNINNTILCMKLNRSQLLIGGQFTKVGTFTRNRLASINLITGIPNSWDPNCSDLVNSIELNKSDVYFGGKFLTVSGQTRNYLASIDTNGILSSWKPNPDNIVTVLLMTDTSKLFVGGSFKNINSTARAYLAKLDITSKGLDNWNGNLNASVTCMTSTNGLLYIGGTFTSVTGKSRLRLACLEVNSGVLNNWNPNSNGSITNIYSSNSFIYLGGSFITISSVFSPYLAKLKNCFQGPNPASKIIFTNVDCNNGTFTAYSDTIPGSEFYNWVLPTGYQILSGQGSNLINVKTGLAPGDICVSTTNQCGASASFCSPFKSTSGPNQFTIKGPDTVCSNAKAINFTVDPVQANTNYTWNVPSDATILPSSETSSITVDWGTLGGGVCAKMSNACFSSATSICKNVLVINKPSSGFDYSTDNDNNFVFSLFDSNIQSAHWDFGDGQTSTQINPSHHFDNAGLYKVCVKVFNPCFSDSLCQSISVAPPLGNINASNDNFNVQLNSSTKTLIIHSDHSIERISIAIVNVNGKIIYQLPDQTISSEFELNLSQLPKGIYIVKVLGIDQQVTQKIVIEN